MAGSSVRERLPAHTTAAGLMCGQPCAIAPTIPHLQGTWHCLYCPRRPRRRFRTDRPKENSKMGRIHRLLNYLRDETGVINPTRYRLSEDGRSLIYDATLPPKTPLHFHIKHRTERDIRPVPCGYSISCPGMCLRDLSWLEFVYLYQQIVASPFITRCNIHSDSIQSFVPSITVTETPNPLIASKQYIPSGGKWGTRQDTIDLTPGSADFQLAVSLKKQVREEKNRPHRLRRRGIMAFLQTLGLDQQDADFSIGFPAPSHQ